LLILSWSINKRNKPSRNKNCLWWPCLLTDRDEMSNLYRGPSINAFYQVSVHLAKRFRRRRFFKIGQSETRIACVPLKKKVHRYICSYLFFLAHLARPLTFHILIFSSKTLQPNEQSKTWISNIKLCGLFCVELLKMRGGCSFCWYWWNCWPWVDDCLNVLLIISIVFS
jgi:hypothetical protein